MPVIPRSPIRHRRSAERDDGPGEDDEAAVEIEAPTPAPNEIETKVKPMVQRPAYVEPPPRETTFYTDIVNAGELKADLFGRGWSVERVHEHMAKCYVGFELRERYEAEASGKPTRRLVDLGFVQHTGGMISHAQGIVRRLCGRGSGHDMAEVVSRSEGRAARSRYSHGRLMRKHMQVVMAVHGCIPDPNPLPLPPALVAPPTADVTQIRAQIRAQATEDYAPQHAAYELARRVVIAFQQVAISVRVFATERQEAG